MHCVRCGRPLKEAARSIPSRNGPLMWGRVCAIRSGLLEPKPRTAKVVHTQQAEYDPNQMALELSA